MVTAQEQIDDLLRKSREPAKSFSESLEFFKQQLPEIIEIISKNPSFGEASSTKILDLFISGFRRIHEFTLGVEKGENRLNDEEIKQAKRFVESISEDSEIPTISLAERWDPQWNSLSQEQKEQSVRTMEEFRQFLENDLTKSLKNAINKEEARILKKKASPSTEATREKTAPPTPFYTQEREQEIIKKIENLCQEIKNTPAKISETSSFSVRLSEFFQTYDPLLISRAAAMEIEVKIYRVLFWFYLKENQGVLNLLEKDDIEIEQAQKKLFDFLHEEYGNGKKTLGEIFSYSDKELDQFFENTWLSGLRKRIEIHKNDGWDWMAEQWRSLLEFLEETYKKSWKLLIQKSVHVIKKRENSPPQTSSRTLQPELQPPQKPQQSQASYSLSQSSPIPNSTTLSSLNFNKPTIPNFLPLQKKQTQASKYTQISNKKIPDSNSFQECQKEINELNQQKKTMTTEKLKNQKTSQKGGSSQKFVWSIGGSAIMILLIALLLLRKILKKDY